jgi:hypothetical protein
LLGICLALSCSWILYLFFFPASSFPFYRCLSL